jgi:hypothetical protein
LEIAMVARKEEIKKSCKENMDMETQMIVGLK